MTDTPTVLVVDFGAQYAQLIARRVREARVYSEIVPHTVTAAEIAERAPAALIFSGGPKSVNVEHAPMIDPGVYDLGIPILGICYGAQLIAKQCGGSVGRYETGEYGRTELHVTHAGVLFGGQPHLQQVWMSHFDAIDGAPDGCTPLAHSDATPVAAFESTERKLFGVQYHPEVSHTPAGQQLLERFLYEGAGIEPTWTMDNIIDAQVELIRAQVGAGRAICGLSGGVDSAVAAALVHKAIGPQLTCVFVDTGLMRKDEGDQVVETFKRNQGIELIHVRAADRFFDKLDGVVDPEDKRKAIGETVHPRVRGRRAGSPTPTSWCRERCTPTSSSRARATPARIKSHHNVGGLPDDMDFELVEPLRALFKDEVRAVGSELGLPDEIVWRQPFPGPGLGVRIIGEVTPDKVVILQEADAIVRDEIAKAGLEREIWQAFAVLPDIRSVGVMGDERTYAHPIIIRAVDQRRRDDRRLGPTALRAARDACRAASSTRSTA